MSDRLPLNLQRVARIMDVVNKGKGRCTLRELRQVVGDSLPVGDVLADNCEITFGGRKLVVRDGWVTAEVKE